MMLPLTRLWPLLRWETAAAAGGAAAGGSPTTTTTEEEEEEDDDDEEEEEEEVVDEKTNEGRPYCVTQPEKLKVRRLGFNFQDV